MTFDFARPPPKIGDILSAHNHYGQKCYYLVINVSSKVKFDQGSVYYALKLYSLISKKVLSTRWRNGTVNNVDFVNESLTND